MEIIIEDEETCALAKELAQLTGEDITKAITNAVRERLERAKYSKKTGVAERLMEIGRETAAFIKEPWKSTPHGDLLYDENGLPKSEPEASERNS
jgi:antitoxin VapB